MKKLVKLNLARNSLRYVIKAYKIKKIYVPYYICPTVKIALRKENIKIDFYHIDKNFMPKNNFEEDDYILYPNYFGICSKNISNLERKYQNLIVDNSHSFYSKPVGLASFNSLRKFFLNYGIQNGSFLYIENILNKNFNIAKNYKIETVWNYEKLVRNENDLDSEEILKMSKVTENLINKLDFENDKKRRLEKFNYYHNLYKNKNELNIEMSFDDIPFVYPLLIYDDSVALELEKSGMMIFRYWNNLPKSFEEYDFYRWLVAISL